MQGINTKKISKNKAKINNQKHVLKKLNAKKHAKIYSQKTFCKNSYA